MNQGFISTPQPNPPGLAVNNATSNRTDNAQFRPVQANTIPGNSVNINQHQWQINTHGGIYGIGAMMGGAPAVQPTIVPTTMGQPIQIPVDQRPADNNQNAQDHLKSILEMTNQLNAMHVPVPQPHNPTRPEVSGDVITSNQMALGAKTVTNRVRKTVKDLGTNSQAQQIAGLTVPNLATQMPTTVQQNLPPVSQIPYESQSNFKATNALSGANLGPTNNVLTLSKLPTQNQVNADIAHQISMNQAQHIQLKTPDSLGRVSNVSVNPNLITPNPGTTTANQNTLGHTTGSTMGVLGSNFHGAPLPPNLPRGPSSIPKQSVPGFQSLLVPDQRTQKNLSTQMNQSGRPSKLHQGSYNQPQTTLASQQIPASKLNIPQARSNNLLISGVQGFGDFNSINANMPLFFNDNTSQIPSKQSIMGQSHHPVAFLNQPNK